VKRCPRPGSDCHYNSPGATEKHSGVLGLAHRSLVHRIPIFRRMRLFFLGSQRNRLLQLKRAGLDKAQAGIAQTRVLSTRSDPNAQTMTSDGNCAWQIMSPFAGCLFDVVRCLVSFPGNASTRQTSFVRSLKVGPGKCVCPPCGRLFAGEQLV